MTGTSLSGLQSMQASGNNNGFVRVRPLSMLFSAPAKDDIVGGEAASANYSRII